ncbi:MAG: NlpC/P60 family protein [Actinomycetes bacterium]
MTARLRLTVGAALVAALVLPVGQAHAVPQTTGGGVRTAPSIDSLHDRADDLRRQLEDLRDRAAWTDERLAYARDQLAAATSNSITADEQLATLQGTSSAAESDIAHRVRAIEQSGGAAALFTQAIDADAITDVTSNVAALNGVLDTDLVRAADAHTARDQMADVRGRLDTIADERALLSARARTLADQARTLVADQRALVAAADVRVANLVKTMEQKADERATASAANAVPWTGPIPEGPTSYAAPAIAAALSKLGSPYVWGDAGPSTFDCSGLIQWSYLQAGLVLPRVSSDQWSATTPVPVDDMQPGDLIVYAYNSADAGTIHHIAMYIGNGQMVHAPRTGDVVRVVPVYHEGLYGVGRPGL